jgi:putative ABC transport system permease protein
MEGITGIDSVARIVYGRASLKFRDKEITSTVYGTDQAFFDQSSDYFKIEDGRYFNDNDRRVVVLGNDAAKKDFDRYEISVGNVLEINGKDYRVIGILERIGTSLSAQDDGTIYIPYEDGRDEFEGQLVKDEIQFLSMKLSEGYTSDDVRDEIESTLASNHKVKADDPDFTLITSEFIEETVGSLLTTLSAFLLFITLIATFVGAIGIMNTMLMGVLERVREIGILKAVGASETDILLIFIVESGILGFMGGVIGLAIGFVILLIVGQFGVPYLLAPWIIGFAFIFSAFVGVLAGAIPARKAAELDPVEALRYE